jgi:short-subunit dehydrogenase
MSIYYASKAFVISFSYAIASEVRKSGVSVSVLCPGATRTDFSRTAGTSDSRLNKSGMMEPRRVAEAGVRGLLAGKRMIVPGLANKLVAVGSRFVPRGMAARTAGALNSDR